MRVLRFFKLSPGGNSTILILDPVPAGERAPTARRLMDVHHLQAEQVGYLDLHARPVRLDMMGGEFCGNACRAAAAVMLRENPALFMEEETKGSLHADISVSGVEDVLRVKAVSGPHGYEYWARMPLPSSPEMAAELAPGVGLVSLPGIAHLCLDQTMHPFPADWAAQAAGLRRKYGLDQEAVGCIWHEDRAIRPVVWVRATNSTHLETGCGSGSLALALWLGRGKIFPIDMCVRQPSGQDIGVRVEKSEDGFRAWIHGPVAIVAHGETYV